MNLRGLLPERSVDDVLAGQVTLVLGGQEVSLPVLPIAANRRWRELFGERLGLTIDGADQLDDAPAVLAYLGAQTDLLWDLLTAYDADGRLPEKAWVEEHATEPELVRALFGVLAAAFPLVATVASLLRQQPGLVRDVIAQAMTTPPAIPVGPTPAPMSSPRRNGAGRRARSSSR